MEWDEMKLMGNNVIVKVDGNSLFGLFYFISFDQIKNNPSFF